MANGECHAANLRRVIVFDGLSQFTQAQRGNSRFLCFGVADRALDPRDPNFTLVGQRSLSSTAA